MHFDFAQYKQRGQTVIYILIGVLILIGVSGGAYYLGRQTNKPQLQNSVVTSNPQPAPSPVDETANWETYTSLNGKYQFQYPNDVTIYEEKQLRTDVFENYTYLKKGDQILATIVFFTPSYTRYATLDDFARGERLQRDDLLGQTKETLSIAKTTAYKFKLNAYGYPKPVVIVKLNNQYINFFDHGFQNFDRILSTFKFTETNPSPTCRPRPTCLDTKPRCLIAETDDMCPPVKK